MQYTLIIWQREEGCDYTIGCGVRIEEFSAIDRDMAEQKARDFMRDMVHRECHIKRARLLPAEYARDIDVTSINARADKDNEEERERREYERLREKFG